MINLKILNLGIAVIILGGGCSHSNTCLKVWPGEIEKQSYLSVVDSISSDCSFVTHAPIQLSHDLHSRKQISRMEGGKFFVQPVEKGAQEFQLFDLNEPNKIVFVEYQDTVRNYQCQFQDKFELKDGTIVQKIRIKRFYKLPKDCGGSYLDLYLFATMNFGIIGTYNYDPEKNVILGDRGEIFRNYIDYSNKRFVNLSCG